MIEAMVKEPFGSKPVVDATLSVPPVRSCEPPLTVVAPEAAKVADTR